MSAPTATETLTEIIQTAVTEMAKKLEMRAELAANLEMRKEEKLDWRTTWDEELMMLVTSEGIIVGRVKVEYGEMRTYKYERFTLNGVELLEKRYGITESGWEHMPTVTYQLDEETVIYTGW